MQTFTNSIVLPDNLPSIEKESFNLLDKKYLKIMFIRIAIIYLVIIGAFVGFLLLPHENLPSAIGFAGSAVIAVPLIYTIIITLIGFPKKGYLVREKDISFQKGIITYKLTTVPFNRIQHVEVNQGVLEKSFKLSSLKIFTAGGNASDLSIPGLPKEVAQNLKAFLSEKISEHE